MRRVREESIFGVGLEPGSVGQPKTTQQDKIQKLQEVANQNDWSFLVWCGLIHKRLFCNGLTKQTLILI